MAAEETGELVDLLVNTFSIDARMLSPQTVAVNDRTFGIQRRSRVNSWPTQNFETEQIVIADRVSQTARQQARTDGWNYLDLSGHLRIWTTKIKIDTDIPKAHFLDIEESLPAPFNRVGLEIAVTMLENPSRPASRAHWLESLDETPDMCRPY